MESDGVLWPISGHILYLNPLQKTECQPGAGRPLAMRWISFQGDHDCILKPGVLAAEPAAIKEVFELGLMVVLCFEVTVY